MSNPTILAIESSCDDTGVAILKDKKILSNVVANQAVHEQYGGVVPELASRAHEQNIIPTVSQSLHLAKIKLTDLDVIAFTLGPGLLGSLLVGSSFAKGIAMSMDIPLIGVNHMEAHVLSHFIDIPSPSFPFLCLTVSGGHTQIVLVKNHTDMEVLGETLDDAVGEAFDKTATLLNLPYPGGVWIDKYAKKGNPKAFKFPKVNVKGLNFSFSGIKTAFLYFLQDRLKEDSNFITKYLSDICASMQYHLITLLLEKVKIATKHYCINRVAIAGGVAANSCLRKRLKQLSKEEDWSIFIPDTQYCTDNAAMIAIAAYYRYAKKEFSSLDILPQSRFNISSI